MPFRTLEWRTAFEGVFAGNGPALHHVRANGQVRGGSADAEGRRSADSAYLEDACRHLRFEGARRSDAADARLNRVLTDVRSGRDPRVGVLRTVVAHHNPVAAILAPVLVLERRRAARRPGRPRDRCSRVAALFAVVCAIALHRPKAAADGSGDDRREDQPGRPPRPGPFPRLEYSK